MESLYFLAVLSVLSLVAGCPDGWVRHIDRCYHFSHDTETFTGAEGICKDFGGSLIEIETAQENIFIGNQARLLKTQYRTALTDLAEEGTWVWMETKSPAEYTNWGPGEPDSRSQDENCVDIGPTGQWYDVVCHDNRPFICEMAELSIGVVG